MAQLIKLRDYISRYEWNAYRYPSQYIRLKQENWQRLHQLWLDQDHLINEEFIQKQESSYFSKLKSFIRQQDEPDNQIIQEELLPTTELDLKQYFLNKLFPLQMKWATSTVADVSFFDKSYSYDRTLKYFLQRFPDIYLVMYYPIFNIKNASIDGEIILISPFEIEIIYLLEENPQSTIMAGDERTWLVENQHAEKTIISPLISLKRTEHIIKGILHRENVDFPVKKVVVSRTNNIVFSSEPFQTSIIGKYQYEQWFIEKRKLTSSLKSNQLKATEALLKYCLTTSIKRPEWEEETNEFTSDREE